MDEKIDFVIAWVDGSDPNWLKEKNKYAEKKITTANSDNRFRDAGTIKYLLRSIEKYASWVNKVYFVTWGHLPDWLDVDNPKLVVVKHSDFIPSKYLPTFNANTIELNFHRIKGLSEHFVYFNDDMLINKAIKPSYFFKNGLPCDVWRETVYCLSKDSDNLFAHLLLNDKHLICRNFYKRDVIKRNFFKVFNPIYGRKLLSFTLLAKWPYMADFEEYHTASALLKSTYKEVWEKEYACLDETCMHKFRDRGDVNQYAIQLWQVFSGNFTPRSYKDYGQYYDLSDDNSKLINDLQKSLHSILCINDSSTNIDFEKAKKELITVLEQKFPDKSFFEK